MSVPWVHTLPLPPRTRPPPPLGTRPPVWGMWKQTPALGADTPWKEHGTRLTGSVNGQKHLKILPSLLVGKIMRLDFFGRDQ